VSIAGLFPTHLYANRGFNLVEAAIVLGVVGLVIGGIWAAAAQLNYQHKLSLSKAGVLYYVDLTAKNFPFRVAQTYPSDEDVDKSFLAQQMPPAGWTVQPTTCCGMHPTDPFGYTLFMQIQPRGTFTVSMADLTGKNIPNGLLKQYGYLLYHTVSSLYPNYGVSVTQTACQASMADCPIANQSDVNGTFWLPNQ